jgi:hypothetical protein
MHSHSILPTLGLLLSVHTAFAAPEAPATLEARFSEMARTAAEKTELLSELANSADEAATIARLRELRRLHTYLNPGELHALESALANPARGIARELAGLIGDQGDPSSFEATSEELRPLLSPFPHRDLDIRPTAGSDWPFERWSTLPEFANYDFAADGSVRFRGLELRSGDIFLIDLNDDSSDLYTAYTTNESLYGHFAIFAILERNGLRFPAAIEIHEKGLRAVPLHLFLNPRFAAYVQVYRLKERPQGWDAKISEVVQAALRESHPYDFYSRDQIDGPLTCTAVGSLVLERTGIAPVALRSPVDPLILPNFEELGMDLDRILTPTDYARDSRFESVGSIDNSELPRALAHQLISGAVAEELRERLLDTRRLPGEYQFNLFAIREAQRRTPTGEALLALEGFHDADFPSGPAPLIALMPILDQEMGAAADELTPEIENSLQLGGFSGLEELRQRLAPATQAATSRIRDQFIPR